MIIQLKRAAWPKAKAPFSDGFLRPVTGQYWSLKVWPHFLSDHPNGRLSGGVCECIFLPNIDLFSPPHISTEENSPVKILQEIYLHIYLLGNSSLTLAYHFSLNHRVIHIPIPSAINVFDNNWVEDTDSAVTDLEAHYHTRHLQLLPVSTIPRISQSLRLLCLYLRLTYCLEFLPCPSPG